MQNYFFTLNPIPTAAESMGFKAAMMLLLTFAWAAAPVWMLCGKGIPLPPPPIAEDEATNALLVAPCVPAEVADDDVLVVGSGVWHSGQCCVLVMTRSCSNIEWRHVLHM
jgi:hypothetical protein